MTRCTSLTCCFLFLLFMLSCSGPTPKGHWKLQKIEFMDIPHQQLLFILDRDKPEQLNRQLKQSGFEQLSLQQQEAEIKNVQTALSLARLDLDDDDKFFAVSYGLILPRAVPGWHFGDSLQGRWSIAGDSLILKLSRRDGYSWRFRIVSLTRTEMKLHELFENFTGRGNGLIFNRE